MEAMAEPEGKSIARDRPEYSRTHQRPDHQNSARNQGAERDDSCRPRDQGTDDRQRLRHGQKEDSGIGNMRMKAKKLDELDNQRG